MRLRKGERLYTQSCLMCHGKNGQGDREDLIPAIGGQQYGYLLVRLRNFAQKHNSQEPRAQLQPAVIELLARLCSRVSPDHELRRLSRGSTRSV